MVARAGYALGGRLAGASGVERTDFLIVGGGLAGVSAAETLRGLGARGGITIVSGEVDPPHDRPPLSKEFLRGERPRERLLLHPPEFYATKRIGLLLGRPALSLDLAARELLLADGQTIPYRRLLLATGGRPRKLGVPGETMPGIYELRTLAEAERIKQAAEGATRPIVVGTDPVGMEVAAALTARGLSVTILNMDEQIWPGLLPPFAAATIQQEFEARGVQFHHATRVTAFEGKDRLEIVRADRGDFAADMVVVGAGIRLNTELASAAGLAVDGGILVDEYLRTTAPDVFAAGDVASFPDPAPAPNGAAPVRRHVEHWDNAVAQGRVVGANMAAKQVPFRHVPYFWSELFDLTIGAIGSLDAAEETLLRGTLAGRRFTLLHLRGGALRGALIVNRPRDRRPLTELIRHQTPLTARTAELTDPDVDLATLT